MPPKVFAEKCNGCGICIYECGGFCLALNPKKEKIWLSNGKDCVDCFRCEARCPEEAIEIQPRLKRKGRLQTARRMMQLNNR